MSDPYEFEDEVIRKLEGRPSKAERNRAGNDR